MNRDQETLLLSLAVKKGLLSDEKLNEASSAEGEHQPESSGKRIDWLLKKGHLDPTTLDLLLSSNEFKRESNIPITQIISAEDFLDQAPPSFPVPIGIDIHLKVIWVKGEWDAFSKLLICD